MSTTKGQVPEAVAAVMKCCAKNLSPEDAMSAAINAGASPRHIAGLVNLIGIVAQKKLSLVEMSTTFLVQLLCCCIHPRRDDAIKYVIRRDLADKLANTKIGGIVGSDLRPPYDFVSFEIEPCDTTKDYMRNNRLGSIRDKTKPVECFVFIAPHGESIWGLCHYAQFGKELTQLNGMPTAYHFEHTLDNDGLSYANELPENYIENTFEDSPGDEIINLVMNAIVYATHIETRELLHNQAAIDKTIDRARCTTGRKQSRAQQELAQLRLSSRIVLGSGVKRLERQGGKAMTLVQGHWRNQVCGPKNSKRKLIWIEPFWRGDLGKGVVRDHVL